LQSGLDSLAGKLSRGRDGDGLDVGQDLAIGSGVGGVLELTGQQESLLKDEGFQRGAGCKGTVLHGNPPDRDSLTIVAQLQNHQELFLLPITATQGATLNLYDNWSNQGAISVDSSSTVSLGGPVTDSFTYSATAGYTWNNSGTLAIAPGPTINLGDYFTTDDFENHFRQLGVNLDLSQYKVNLIGTIDNSPADNPLTGGNLLLDRATGPLYLSAGVITGGTITTRGSNDLVASNAGYNYDYSNGFAIVGTIVFFIYDYSNPLPIGGGTLDGVTLNGTLDMQSVPAATATVLGGLTLKGTIYLTGSGAALDFGSGAGDSTPETIGGSGVIQFGPQNAVSLENTGTGALTLGPGITVVGGGNSVIDSPNAPVINQGTIMVGDPFGALTVEGNYTQTATGVLLIQIADHHQCGQLVVTGTATLAGTLQVSLLGDDVPAVGTNFQIMTFAELAGGFTTDVGLALPSHEFLKPVWGSNDLTLTVSD
jgi:hypothetical protein